MIVNVAYFTGVIWIIYCQINFALQTGGDAEYFYDEYDLHSKEN